ncbi:hypothetical protein RHGRI_013532 [Rhododendron griersonianum]|uniref:Reverse transcriptase-like protein n=1 Tax=Rhododendron griersonianum TaxID=479676 RepID=A0AAV6K5Y3_9ERIC|nr:hypothetical protein RHGRI_013532 [Rhododendron griersonianum]
MLLAGYASWGWRSILWGKELLCKGLKWRIGNGETIDVFQDEWLPNSANPFTSQNMQSVFSNFKMALGIRIRVGEQQLGFRTECQERLLYQTAVCDASPATMVEIRVVKMSRQVVKAAHVRAKLALK